MRNTSLRHRWGLTPTAFGVLCLLGLVLALVGCGGRSDGATGSGDSPNLLSKAVSTDSSGVSRAGRLTDGTAAVEGDHWQTNLTSILPSPRAYVQYDFGRPLPICCAYLQADGDDHYVLSASMDGVTFKPMWTARSTGGGGLQSRSTDRLKQEARYIRVTATRGDGRYSLSEVVVASARPPQWPPQLDARKGEPSSKAARTRIHFFAIASILFLLLYQRKSPKWMRLVAILPIAALLALTVQLVEMWPIGESEQSLLRAVVAAIAGVLVFRDAFLAKRFEPDHRVSTVSLAVLAVIAVGCFYHFGMPQFRDESKDRTTLVHPWDMRVYFPLTKYFHELRFDGLYLASLAAYLDNNPSQGPTSIASVRLRDLRNNEMREAREVTTDIQQVRTRFSPERWEDFKKDMLYFQGLMGRNGYLGSLRDHGGNATPVWVLSAYPMFAKAAASELVLSLSALLDPLLLAIMFTVMARTFGLRAMLLCLIVFGVTDFSRFGTNLMGSTLRYDWIAALGLGVCLLHKRYWVLGGALLAYAGLIRGFPALATMFLIAPTLWWLIDWYRDKKRLPSWKQTVSEQKPFLRAAFGVVACVTLLVALSSALFSYQGSWGLWFEKISAHAVKPNVNHVGLRNVLSFEADKTGDKVIRNELPEPWTDWQRHQMAAFERRLPLFYIGIGLFGLLILAACRKKRLDQAAVMGLFFIPIIFYPANYYMHYVFLLPLAAVVGRHDKKDKADVKKDNAEVKKDKADDKKDKADDKKDKADDPLLKPKSGRAATRSGEESSERLLPWFAVVLCAMSVAQYPTLSERWSDVCYTQQTDILLLGFMAMLIPAAWFALRPGKKHGSSKKSKPRPAKTPA